MEYSISNAYKDVEQILKRPLNSFEYMKIETWISRYSLKYLQLSFKQLSKMQNIYSTNFIDTYLFRNYSYYQEIIASIGNDAEIKIDSPKQEEKPKVKEYINDWDEHSEEEREYWLAMLKHVFYPEEYPKPNEL